MLRLSNQIGFSIIRFWKNLDAHYYLDSLELFAIKHGMYLFKITVIVNVYLNQTIYQLVNVQRQVLVLLKIDGAKMENGDLVIFTC